MSALFAMTCADAVASTPHSEDGDAIALPSERAKNDTADPASAPNLAIPAYDPAGAEACTATNEPVSI